MSICASSLLARVFLSSLYAADVGLFADTVLFSVVELICSLIAWTDRERSKLHLASPFDRGLFPHHLAGEPHYTSADQTRPMPVVA